jgi:signal transduction histidine kinase
MAINKNCLLVGKTGVTPFKRCDYCEKPLRDCFGVQFFSISTAIITLLALIFFISDLPILVIDAMVLISALVALLAFLASKETNEIVLNNSLLSQMNKGLEDKVQQRTLDLERSNEELRKIDQMKNDFIGIINHELKEPITVVLSGIEVIRARGFEKLDESQQKMINVMEQSGKEMQRLTNNLLDLSKIESGKVIINNEKLQLSTLLDEVILSLKQDAEKKNVKIITKIEGSVSVIYGDSFRLKQALYNIVDNAIKYTKENGTISISAESIGMKVQIQIKDTGIGIAKKDLSSIFDKFAKRAAGYKGTGLGLYISKSFIEAHKGEIKVESEYGKGTTFKLYLPKKQTS